MNWLELIRNIFAVLGLIVCICCIGGYFLYRGERWLGQSSDAKYPEDFYNGR